MNATATSAPSPVPEVPLTRAAKEVLLRQMYSRAHWIELIRLIGYQTVPMDKARQAIKPLAEQYGKDPLAQACEVLVEIFTQDKDSFARLKPHIRRMSFQILGPEPSTIAPTSVPQTASGPARRDKTKPKKAATKQSPADDTVSLATGKEDAIMQQYRAAKEKHPGMLLLFRMGDFYEMFGQDAETAHKLLGLTLTTRDRTIAMSGFPHHQLEVYLHKLLHEGQRVAICEPVEESLARGPIRREVTRAVTPGTPIEDGKSESAEASVEGKGAKSGDEQRPVKQPRHYVLKQFEAWLNEAELAFVAVEDVRRTTPAVAAYVGVLDFIVMRGEEKLLVTVRPSLLAKHQQLIRELQNLFGPEYKPVRYWPSDGPDGWTWHEYAVVIPAAAPVTEAKRKPRVTRSRTGKSH